MSASKRRSENAPVRDETLQAEQAPAADNGRDARGRFNAGNAGGPGNPFARRVAALRKVLLETVTDDELRIVAGQLMVKAKFGDLAAIKLLFQYVLGKPAATVDPDALDLEEVDLYRRAPVHGEVNDVLTARMPADLAAGLLRQVVPYVGQEHANLMAEAITNPEAFAKEDEWDEEDEEDEEPGAGAGEAPRSVAAAERSGPAPSTNGGMNADPRRRATPPSTNGPTFKDQPARPASGNGDNEGRSPDAPQSEQRPPRGS